MRYFYIENIIIIGADFSDLFWGGDLNLDVNRSIYDLD